LFSFCSSRRIIEDTYENVLSQGSDDYVTIILTDDKDLDVFDMQDRISPAKPKAAITRQFLITAEESFPAIPSLITFATYKGTYSSSKASPSFIKGAAAASALYPFRYFHIEVKNFHLSGIFFADTQLLI